MPACEQVAIGDFDDCNDDDDDCNYDNDDDYDIAFNASAPRSYPCLLVNKWDIDDDIDGNIDDNIDGNID